MKNLFTQCMNGLLCLYMGLSCAAAHQQSGKNPKTQPNAEAALPELSDEDYHKFIVELSRTIAAGECSEEELAELKAAMDQAIDSGEIETCGFFPLQITLHNKKFEIGFMIMEKEIPDAEKFIGICVIYDDFPLQDRAREDIQCTLKGISQTGTAFQIHSKQTPIRKENIKRIEKLKKESKALWANTWNFMITKKEFKALLNAQDIQYTVVLEKQTIQGMFPEPALQSLRINGKDLLNKKPF